AGTFGFEVNAGSVAVQGPVTVSNLATPLSVTLNVAAGPLVRVNVPDAVGTRLKAAGGIFGGSYTLRPAITADLHPVVVVAVTGLNVTMGDGASDLVSVTGGSGLLLLTTQGLAGSVTASIQLADKTLGVGAGGTFRVEFNDIASAVSETVNVGGTVLTVDLPAGNFVRVRGTGVTLTVLGQRLSGNFLIQKDGAGIRVDVSDAAIAFSDSVKELVYLEGVTASLTLKTDSVFGPCLAGQLTGSARVSLPGVSVLGTYTINLDTRPDAAGPYLVHDGDGVDFIVYQKDTAAAAKFDKITVEVSEDGSVWKTVAPVSTSVRVPGDDKHDSEALRRGYDLNGTGLAAARFIRIKGIPDGRFELDAVGIVPRTAWPELLLFPPLSSKGTTVALASKAAGAPDDVAVDLGTDGAAVFGPGAPLVSMTATNATLEVLGQKVTGNFMFRESRTVAGNTVELRVSGATARFGAGTGLVQAALADGSVVFSNRGVTASLTGTVTVAVTGVSLDGSFAFQLDTTQAQPYVRLSGIGVKLTVSRQVVSGDFVFEGATASDGKAVVRAAVANAGLDLAADTSKFLSVSAARGAMVVTESGLAAAIEGAVASQVGDFTLTAIKGRIEINTAGAPVDETIAVGSDSVRVQVASGPFVHVVVIGGHAALKQAQISGDFTFSQTIRQADGVVLTTQFAMANVAVTLSGQGLQNGRGAFIIIAGGVAGVLTGEASIDTAGVTVGGTLGFRVNTTGADVDQTIELPGRSIHIVLAKDLLEFFGAGLSFNVGDFVTVEGTVAFTAGEFAGTGLTLFLGQGPFRLDAGAENPAAVGVVLRNARVAVVQGSGSTLAFIAAGQIELKGVAGVTASGTATVRYNDTGAALADRTFDFGTPDTSDDLVLGFTDAEKNLRNLQGDIHLAVFNQTLEGTFAFDRAETASGGSAVVASFTGVRLSLGNGTTSFVNVTDGHGAIVVTGDGVAGTLGATVGVTDGTNSFAAGLTGTVDFNNTGVAVEQSVTVGATTINIDVPAGPFLRVELRNCKLSILGQELSGDFVFEERAAEGGGRVVRVEVRGATLAFGSGADALVTVRQAQGEFTIDDTGVTGSMSGAVATLVPGLSFEANFSVAVDTRDADPLKRFIRASATDARLKVAGQTLSGDFKFEETGAAGSRVVTIAASDARFGFGDGTKDYVAAVIASATLTVTKNGVAAAVTNADLAVDFPGLSLSGRVDLVIDTTADPQVFSATGTDVDLTVAGQALTGNFTIRQTKEAGDDGILGNSDDRMVVVMALASAGLVIQNSSGSKRYVDVQNVTGAVRLSAEGLAGQLTGTATLGITGVATVGASLAVAIKVNTSPAAVNDKFGVGGSEVLLDVPAGPFLYVEATGVEIVIGTIHVTGDFSFQQEQRDNGEGGTTTVTSVALANLNVTISGQTLDDGRGFFVITEDGVAGSATGTATVAAGGFSAGGNIGLRVNKTGHEIDETVTLAGRTMRIQFGPGETNLLEFFGAGLSLNIGSFVTLEGDIVLSDAGNGWQVFGANKALLFVGQGPLRLYEGRDEINPSASGLLIRNARVGVVKNTAAGTFAMVAEGDIEVVGVAGVSFSGKARVRFNNTGIAVSRTISFTTASGGTETAVVSFSDTSAVSVVEGTALQLTVAGQTLSGNFAFSKMTVGGEEVLVVAFSKVQVVLGSGLVTVSDGAGTFVLTRDGLAGTATGAVAISAGSGVSLSGTVALAINSTGVAVSRSFTIGAVPVSITLPAGPFVRVIAGDASVAGDEVDLKVAGQTLRGDFAFERGTLADGTSVVTVAFANVQLALSDGSGPRVTVSGAKGVFLLTSAGLAGLAQGAVSLTVPGVSLAGAVGLAINTRTTAVAEEVTLGGTKQRLQLAAGKFVRIEAAGVDLTAGGQTLHGDFAFEQSTATDGSTCVIVAAANLRLGITDGSKELVSVTQGQGVFVLDSGGLFGQASAAVSVDPATGVSVSGGFSVLVNTCTTDRSATIWVGGKLVTINVARAPPGGVFLQVVASGARLVVGGLELTADRFAFEKGASAITVSGTNLGFVLRAGTRRIVGLRNASFELKLTQAGLAGAAINGQVLGPEFGGDITLSGTVSLKFNTTATAETFILSGSTIDVPAAPAAGSFLEVAVQGGVLEVFDNRLSADTLLFRKSGSKVEVEGTNFSFNLAAGGKRIVSLTGGDFAFRFTDAGVVGTVVNATLQGPELAGVNLGGTISLLVNTTPTAQVLHVGAAAKTIPGASAGGYYIRVEVTAAVLTILGNGFEAGKLVFERDGANVGLSGSGVHFFLQAGATRIVEVAGADFAFLFTSSGVAGAVKNATLTGPALAGVSLAGTVAVLVNTTPDAATLTVGGADVTVPGAGAAGSYVRVEVTGAALTVLGNSLTADRLVLEKRADVVDAWGENLGLTLEAAGKRILKLEHADFALRFAADGVAGAALNAAVTGPDFGLGNDFAISGTVAVLVNTTGRKVDLTVGGTSVAIAAASPDPFVRVDVTGGTLTVLSNELKADRFSFQKSGATVEISGENLDFSLKAGLRRVLELHNAGFLFRFSDAGIIGAVANATVIGPDFGNDLQLSGTSSLIVNTTASAVTFTLGTRRIIVPAAAAGGSFGRVERAPATLRIVGVSLTADA
ncbi:MAG: hypothetical protein NTU94_07500, partial [Planctomycetota bacterium]|nr:hypothetical protein [Planctomycetota bacterium]